MELTPSQKKLMQLETKDTPHVYFLPQIASGKRLSNHPAINGEIKTSRIKSYNNKGGGSMSNHEDSVTRPFRIEDT